MDGQARARRTVPLKIRVRYAPSPTGFQHIGSARTALYGFLFARKNKGTFILRIEDTDRKRLVPEAMQDIYDTFSWLGFHWDEGPDVGGPVGPYFQSERLPLYREWAEKLLADGHAYRCYCSEERLEKLRKAQEEAQAKAGGAGKDMVLGYDRHCRNLSDAERRALETAGTPSVIRLKIPLEGSTTYRDEILGEITIENRVISPDPVLLKTDGFPTYHLANVVDDHFMEITHVMRGHEWLPSVPIYEIMYDALGWTPPAYFHLPMVMGKDGHKLSKRLGAASVRDFKAQGYLPDALVNCIALVGWSYDDSREIFNLKELEELFDPYKLSKSPGVFDYQKLEWFNGMYIRAKSLDELGALIAPVLDAAGMKAEKGMLVGIASLVRERIKRLTEVPDMVRYLFEEPERIKAEDLLPKKGDAAAARRALERVKEALNDLPAGEEETEKKFRALAEELGMKLGDLLMPVRVAVTGSKVSPPLFDSIRLMGVRKAQARIARAMELA
jgi:glutamyl-tRNA synthetase